MLGAASTRPSLRSLVLVGALALSACTTPPRIEVSTAAADEAGQTATTSDGLANQPSPSATSPIPVPPDDSTTTLGIPAPSDALLAGGVDPSTLFRSPEGDVLVQPTPIALQNRALPTAALLSPPASDAFESTIEPLEGAPLEMSTWNELCPVPPTSLRYVTVSFWGFDGQHHRGELIVAANEAENVVSVFSRLHAVGFPIEQMRIITPSDLFARRTGDGNNTASYVCRQVTGGTRFSEHALGLAIDINPFQNPYQRNEVVIPALASSYLDRTNIRPGMIVPGDPVGDEVIAAFADIGWAWGGDWNSLKDYQHFSRNNR